MNDSAPRGDISENTSGGLSDLSGRPVVIGAGIGGLTAALRLAIDGRRPVVLERADQVGGKAHQVRLDAPDGSPREPVFIDGGPTVMTMLNVFESLFADAGCTLQDRITIEPAQVLARHFWPDGSLLDLPADLDEAVESIRTFAGDAEADGFMRYHRYAARIYESVQDIFIFAPKPSPLAMMKLAPTVLPRLIRADLRRTMWTALKSHFKDERLRQLFGRYATYTGNNPFMTPATFNLVAAVEQRGVWRVRGGIKALADALRDLIIERGGEVITGVEVAELESERGHVARVRLANGDVIKTDAVIFNGDVQALSAGLLGASPRRALPAYPKRERSLSALTLCAFAEMRDAPLLHHNVWFSADYRAEFEALERGVLPPDPTIYICAQDRGDTPVAAHTPSTSGAAPERLFALVNAAARADLSPLSPEELSPCQTTVIEALRTLKVKTPLARAHWTTPSAWASRFPATGGAIYGRATRHWYSNLSRRGAETPLKGLYLAGGSVHPGAGVPMVALSGEIAARQLIRDHSLITR